MRCFYSLLLCIFFVESMVAQEVCSPDGGLKVKLMQEEGTVRYEWNIAVKPCWSLRR
jgi:hypothetical protein